MTFQISNPYGNGGYGSVSLGNLTAGVEALQRTEIADKLASIRQQKEWQRDDRLKNEAFALEMASPTIVNDMRAGVAASAMKEADDLLKHNIELVKKADKEGRQLTLPEKMDLKTRFKTVENNSAQAKNFTDAFEKAQGIHIQNLAKITDPVEREQYVKQWADLYSDIQNKDLKDLPPSRIIRAIEPPPPSAGALFEKTSKDIIPFIDSAVKVGTNGRKVVDEEALMKNVRLSAEPNGYLFQKGVEEKRWSTPEEMYGKLADRVRSSIGIDPVGWKPNEKPESEQLSGFEGLYQSSVREGERSQAYVFDKNKYKMKVAFTTPEGKTTNADMTPLAIKENGMIEGEFTVDKNVTTPPMEADQAMLMQVQTGGKLLPADKDGKISVMYSQPTQYVQEVKMSPDMIQKIKRADPKSAKYIQNTVDPYPERTKAEKTGANTSYSPQQESGISKVMKANGISRSEAIEALKAANKLK